MKRYNKRFEMISSQIMRGFVHPNSRPIDPSIIMCFQRRHKDMIELLVEKISDRISVGVPGAIGKAMLWNGMNEIIPFCDAISTCNFKGKADPAHLLYRWLMYRARVNTQETYRVTVTMLRAFVEGKILIHGDRDMPSMYPAEMDLFEWDETYTLMIKKARNNSLKGEVKSVYDNITDSKKAEEIKQLKK